MGTSGLATPTTPEWRAIGDQTAELSTPLFAPCETTLIEEANLDKPDALAACSSRVRKGAA